MTVFRDIYKPCSELLLEFWWAFVIILLHYSAQCSNFEQKVLGMGPLSKVTAVAVAISGRLLSFYDCQDFSFFENLNFLDLGWEVGNPCFIYDGHEMAISDSMVRVRVGASSRLANRLKPFATQPWTATWINLSLNWVDLNPEPTNGLTESA